MSTERTKLTLVLENRYTHTIQFDTEEQAAEVLSELYKTFVGGHDSSYLIEGSEGDSLAVVNSFQFAWIHA